MTHLPFKEILSRCSPKYSFTVILHELSINEITVVPSKKEHSQTRKDLKKTTSTVRHEIQLSYKDKLVFYTLEKI